MVAIPHPSKQPDEPGNGLPESSAQVALPTMYDLPSESLEEPGLPDEFHDLQPQLLSPTLQLTGYSRDQWFTASDLNLYYDLTHTLWYKRPDWFLATAVPRLYDQRELRRSYVTWHEPHPPSVVVEFLSAGTEADDLGRFHPQANRTTLELPDAAEEAAQDKPPSKLEVYELYLQVPHYLVYDRHTPQLRYFRLIEGQYQEQSLHSGNPLVWLDDLQVGLGIWEGVFDGAPGFWLRWCDRQGVWLLTDTEQAELAAQQAEQAAQQEQRATQQERLAKEQAQNQLIQTAQNLLATGMTMEQVTALMNLSSEQIQRLSNSP
jgi:Uma2 family endonuclease